VGAVADPWGARGRLPPPRAKNALMPNKYVLKKSRVPGNDCWDDDISESQCQRENRPTNIYKKL